MQVGKHDLRIIWYDVSSPATLGPPYALSRRTDGDMPYPGIIVVHCKYKNRTAEFNRYGCLRVENVPLTQMEELAKNFLILAEARYGV